MRTTCGVAFALLVCGCVTTPPRKTAILTATPSNQSAVNGTGFAASRPDGWKLFDKGGDYALAAVPQGGRVCAGFEKALSGSNGR
jgi:hypothetical protein